jgi:hypothetical protein
MRHDRIAIATVALALAASLTGNARANGTPRGGTGQAYGQDHGDWDAPPRELQDIQRMGFHDGIIGAQRDIENHRRPDPNNRDEYRHPNLPPYQWDAYRDGFRRGYERGVAHFTGAYQPPAPPPPPQQQGWHEMGQGQGHETRLRGFQDGMDGALHDLDNHRRPDPNNRDEYRHPNVPYELVEAYRDGFRDGYGRGMEILTSGPDRDDRYRGPASDIRHRGFVDGAAGALRDFENNRRPDPNNRDEYRQPNGVPYGLIEAYRDGFRHGYERVMVELSGYSPDRH